MMTKKIKRWTRFERWCKHHLLYLFERSLGKTPLELHHFDKTLIKKILIIRQHDQLGDFLLSTPVLRAVRENFPQSFIALVVRPYFAPVALNNRYVDQVIVTYERLAQLRLSRLRQFWREIRQGFDLAVMLNTVSHSLTSDWIVQLSRARWVIGPDHLPYKGTTRNFFYNFLVPYPTETGHQSRRNLDILRPFGISTANERENMTLLPEEHNWAEAFLQERGRDRNRPCIAVQAGAAKISNRWPVDNFAQAASRLAEQYHAQLLLTWGPKEIELGERLKAGIKGQILFGGFLDMRKTAALFAQADVVLCNDTGIMHLAAAVGTPLVAVFGSTNPDEWKPIGDEFVAVRADDHQIDSVTPDMMVAAASQLLQRKRDCAVDR